MCYIDKELFYKGGNIMQKSIQKNMVIKKPILFILPCLLLILACINSCPQSDPTEQSPEPTEQSPDPTEQPSDPTEQPPEATEQPSLDNDADIIFLHHSTGNNIWRGGVPEWFDNYNTENDTSYEITEAGYPTSEGYGWRNYPYDYWNIWINNEGNEPYLGQETLEILTQTYDVIIFKHCYPVSDVLENTGSPDISSSRKSMENYQLQYNALKIKLREFPDHRFIVWTGAARVQAGTTEANAQRAQTFFNWVKNTWDEVGDNIYIWDFWELETEGGIYLKPEYANNANDSHPNKTFSKMVAPYFGQRIVDVIEGSGDTGSITGN
jgi:hypothetical protein